MTFAQSVLHRHELKNKSHPISANHLPPTLVALHHKDDKNSCYDEGHFIVVYLPETGVSIATPVCTPALSEKLMVYDTVPHAKLDERTQPELVLWNLFNSAVTVVSVIKKPFTSTGPSPILNNQLLRALHRLVPQGR